MARGQGAGRGRDGGELLAVPAVELLQHGHHGRSPAGNALPGLRFEGFELVGHQLHHGDRLGGVMPDMGIPVAMAVGFLVVAGLALADGGVSGFVIALSARDRSAGGLTVVLILGLVVVGAFRPGFAGLRSRLGFMAFARVVSRCIQPGGVGHR